MTGASGGAGAGRSGFRVGHGFDAHRLVEGRPFILGGVTIPFERGPLGHSDADVLAHALGDAILGACCLGDLGRHFPDSDARWKGADSLALLAQCVRLAGEAGYALLNVDATVVVQAPKLAPHIEAIRTRLAGALGLEADAVSVKAKTSEGMGYTGDGSGIAAYAIAALERSRSAQADG
jgi:2-C-methyl-D-erythritol 2,4-cyclodiphosphate synthase